MDESMFETFEEELRTLQDVPPQKPLRQTRQPEMYAQRRVKEEPQIVHQIPKAPSREAPASRVPLRKALSIEDVSQLEAPWAGLTLNRCLLIALTIVIFTSSCQRLHELVRGRKDKTDIETLGNALNLRHGAIRKGSLFPPEPEPSLWETFLWWVSDDEDNDTRRCKTRKTKREKTSRSLRHKVAPDRKLLKRREDSFQSRRAKVKRDNEESQKRVKGQTGKEKRRKQDLEEDDEEEEEEMEEEAEKIQKKTKKSKKKVKETRRK